MFSPNQDFRGKKLLFACCFRYLFHLQKRVQVKMSHRSFLQKVPQALRYPFYRYKILTGTSLPFFIIYFLVALLTVYPLHTVASATVRPSALSSCERED